MDEFDQALDVIEDDKRQVRFVSILEDLYNLLDLLMLTISHKVFWRD